MLICVLEQIETKHMASQNTRKCQNCLSMARGGGALKRYDKKHIARAPPKFSKHWWSMEGTSKANIINVFCISCGLRPRFRFTKSLEIHTHTTTKSHNEKYRSGPNQEQKPKVPKHPSKSKRLQTSSQNVSNNYPTITPKWTQRKLPERSPRPHP